jgi:predicted SPOUT superfamily RNA methylase MTH1
MNLQETLSRYKAGVLSRLSAADAMIMEKATEDLIRDGLVERAKKIGDRAPDFSLPDATGEMVRLADLLARGPVVVTFYRGTW